MGLIHLLVLPFAVCQAVRVAQTPLRSTTQAALHGRFLHITDIHPDTLYKTNASVSSACHRKKPKNEEKRAGYWGTPWAECDTPIRSMHRTFDYLDKNWADEVDFVIWTGDSARHDNDRQNPRTPAEIYGQNSGIVKHMEEIFTKRGIPVVPTLGNNDVWPHNILSAGPNPITNAFVEIWETFVPFASYQVFQRGAYFATEVIPNKVAVISLNTMYFYVSNKAVRGCQYRVAEDPGNLQFDWLDVQLRLFRKRGMQVYLMGHVPPNPGNYFPECFRRYAELSLRFQDTIIGHIYGHMNIDYFSFLSDGDLLAAPVPARNFKKRRLDKVLQEEFSVLPKKSKADEGDYAVITVSPSVVPNPYLPSFRIFSYNTTGAQDNGATDKRRKKKKKGNKHKHNPDRGGGKECKKKKNRDKWECRPQKRRHTDASSPSRSNTLWTPLGYAQFYMPALETLNETHPPSWELEYVTYRVSALHPPANATEEEAGAFVYPVPVHLLPSELRNSSKITKTKFAPYKMDDLTIGSWLKLAHKIKKKEKLWERFKSFMYLRG